MMKHNKRGFTLIELLVVVLIIGILAAVALPQYTTAVEKARLTEAQQMASSLQKAIDLWLLENGKPTAGVDFLGDNTNSSGQLSIDLQNMDCSASDGRECLGKNFSYIAGCDLNGDCYTSALRVLNGSRDTVLYSVQWYRKDSTWYGDECAYYPDVSPAGEKICKMLEAQGNGFYSCEGC